MTIFTAEAEPTLEDLVGEGKKYATPQDLAKAYFHADKTIEQRNREAAELREELSRRMAAEELWEKIQTNTPRQPTPPAQEPATPPVATAALSDEDLVARIEEVTKKQTEAQRVQANVLEVSNKLVETYGTEAKANEVVRSKAQELGVSIEFLQDVAAKSPKAFFTTIGLSASPAPVAAPTQGNVNPVALNTSNPGQPKAGTYAFYEAIRKANPSEYFSVRVQNQMHKDALAKGSDFYK